MKIVWHSKAKQLDFKKEEAPTYGKKVKHSKTSSFGGIIYANEIK